MEIYSPLRMQSGRNRPLTSERTSCFLRSDQASLSTAPEWENVLSRGDFKKKTQSTVEEMFEILKQKASRTSEKDKRLEQATSRAGGEREKADANQGGLSCVQLPKSIKLDCGTG
ncbi:hypothetical protein CDAR_576451 [Caerostris darwini]|uniref:Uncharacterized protein n=1 Tax=Caerostris darwini TaxID=1538125 RepID=A0AAV4TL34_9ARAC|nr:hypothetical protein CDAR_576451 [Caerostris darwini]